MMACKKSCRKFFLRGENACERCKDRESCAETEEEVDEDEDLEDEDESDEDEDESDEDESDEGDEYDDEYEDTYTDAFGNENMRHVFTIPVEEFVWKGRKYSGTICVAADTAEGAKDWLEEQDLDELFGGFDDLALLDGAEFYDEGPVGEDAEHLSCKGGVSAIKETDDEELRD